MFIFYYFNIKNSQYKEIWESIFKVRENVRDWFQRYIVNNLIEDAKAI